MVRMVRPAGWGLGVLALTALLLAAVAAERRAPGSLLPHGYCFTWNPLLVWTHVVSDSLIGAAYVTIPLTLLHLKRRRTDMPFDWMVVLFALFIVSCGLTHWIEVWTVWNPDYWLSASVKVVTAIASVLTAAALFFLVPRILAIPTVAQLRAATQALEAEVAHRRAAEEALRAERAELERRVLERTEALARATEAAESAHAAAESANRLKDQFLAKVSHELRTPLQSTLSWAQLLKSAAGDPERARQSADRIMHNVRTQARLIDDLLDISRILSGKLGLEWVQADAVQVILKAAEVVRGASAARAVVIDISGEPPVLPMRTDPVRLEQVVWNLINNAVQASDDGGRVRVVYRVDGDSLLIDVQDWGRGIDPMELPLIFEPFRQGLDGDRAHRGLGLGLAITRSIVELFGGRLQARSDGPGRGACFTVVLPIGPAPGVAGVGTDALLSDEELVRLRRLRVVYVEDDEDIAEGGRRMLAELGAQVELFTRFDAAQQRLSSAGFDVLLSDMNLGGGRTAMDLLALLRASPHGRDLPAVILSAYGRSADIDATRRAGFAAHLVKPAEAVTVARALLAVVPAG